HRDDVRTAEEDRRVGPERTDHVGVGQRPVSTQCRGAGAGESVGDHALVPALLLTEPEPDRTAVEIHQTPRPLRPLPSDLHRVSGRNPRDPGRPSDHPRRTTQDADDAQLPAIRRRFTHGRVRYIRASPSPFLRNVNSTTCSRGPATRYITPR